MYEARSSWSLRRSCCSVKNRKSLEIGCIQNSDLDTRTEGARGVDAPQRRAHRT